MGSRDRLHNTEALHDPRRDRRVDAAGDHTIGKSETDHVEGIADGVRRTGASRRDHVTRSAEIKIKRHFARNRAESRAGNIIGAHFTQLISKVEPVLLFDKVRRASTAPEHNAPGALFFQARFMQTDLRNAQRFLRCGDGERNRASYTLQLPRRKIVFRLEILHFTGDAARERFRVEERDGIDAAPTTASGIPKFADSDTVGTHRPQSCYDDPTSLWMAIILIHLDSSHSEMLHFEHNIQKTFR